MLLLGEKVLSKMPALFSSPKHRRFGLAGLVIPLATAGIHQPIKPPWTCPSPPPQRLHLEHSRGPMRPKAFLLPLQILFVVRQRPKHEDIFLNRECRLTGSSWIGKINRFTECRCYPKVSKHQCSEIRTKQYQAMAYTVFTFHK